MSDPKSVESVVAAAGTPLGRFDPTRLGPYTVLRRLGAGGMGVVYLARSTPGRLVAIKVIRSDVASNPAFRARFRREAATARRIARFCTAEVLDADPDAEQPYLVTEYVDGPTLAAVVASDGPLPSANLERLAVGVAAALTAIHRAGVVHQDLKPANVLMSQFGPRVIDFGIARSVDAATRVRQDLRGLGTPAFMAPEQVRGGVISAAADIFAWGGAVAFAGTGRCAFGEGSTESVLYRVTREEPRLEGLDPALRPLVVRALSKEAADRPSATELLWSMIGSPPAEQQAAVTEVMHGWAPLRTEPTTRPPTRTSGRVDATGRRIAAPGPTARPIVTKRTGSIEPPNGPVADPAGTNGPTGTNGPADTNGPATPARQVVSAPAAGPPATGPPATSRPAERVQSEPPGRRIRHLTSSLPAVIVVLVVLVTALAGFVGLSLTGAEKTAASFTREPVFEPGPNPFLPPVGKDMADVQPPPKVGHTYPANTPGLYGGTPSHSSCDIGKMAELLRRNPDRATAWSGVLGVRPQDAPSHLRTLTPVILRTDTYVTNYRYAGNRAVAISSVLQAGTAVLVDRYGRPATKCNCGNPLTAPSAHSNPTFVGPAWPAFSPTMVTIIEGSPSPLVSFTLVDPSTNRPFVRPGSTDGGNDQPYTPPPSTTNPPSSGGSPSTEPPSGTPSGGGSSAGMPSTQPAPSGTPSGGGSSYGGTPSGGGAS